MNHQNYDHKKAWVLFSNNTDLPWLKLLKPGFRHCSVLLNDGTQWITLDPMSHYTDIMVHNVPVNFNLPLWLEDRGYTVVETQLSRKRKPAPWMVFTCVEAVKRVLGLHSRFIVTPWQLHRHLTKSQVQHSQSYKGEFAWEV